MLRVLVCGSRSLEDYDFVKSELDRRFLKLKPFEMVTGACPQGADKLAETWALRNWITLKRFHAQWTTFGKRAGPLRNQEMVDFLVKGDLVLAFYDGTSAGTADCIKRARKKGLRVKVVLFEQG